MGASPLELNYAAWKEIAHHGIEGSFVHSGEDQRSATVWRSHGH